MKTLKQLLEKTDKAEPTAPIEPDSVTSYVPKTKDEKRFMDKHVVQKTADANKNGDDLFRGSNIKAYDRSATRHGYNSKEDQKVYESKTLMQILGEKTLTSAEMKKREEIAQAMERDNPGMDKSKKMAIATATAKRVAEQVLDERMKTTHEDPLVTVHDKDGLHTHANLSVANNIFGTKVKHTDVHAGKTKAKSRDGGDLTFAISKHHAAALKEESEETDLFACFADDVRVRVEKVYEQLSDDHKQVVIEMIEAEEYDELVNIVDEVLNG